MNADHASLSVSSRQPGRSLHAAGLNIAPALASAEAEGVGADLGVRSGGAVGFADGAFGAGATGAGATGLLGAVGVGVDSGVGCATSGTTIGFLGALVHALKAIIAANIDACIDIEARTKWIFGAASLIMAASITSDLSMELLLLALEALVALLLLFGIVWWTMPRKRKDSPPDTPDQQ